MGQKLKIVFLCRFCGTALRGVETHVGELSKRLSQKHQVDVLAGADADNLGLVLKGHYDLVIPTNGRWQALKVSLGRTVGGYKTLIAGHAGIGRDDIWNILVTKPDVFVALTDYQLAWAKKFLWGSKLVKIPNGVDLDKFSPSGKKAVVGLERPIILSVGSLKWYKYHDRAIAAVKALKKGSLLIIGQGEEKDRLLDQGKDLVAEHRLKIITVSYEQMPEYYRAADLFTLPSWDREAFGIVYLEAMASCLAVVAPDDQPRREIIGPAGILTDVAKPQVYAQAIHQALSKDWGDLPLKQASNFSWEKIASQYLKLLADLFKND